MNTVIAIDGPVAAGKGTIAKAIASHFGFAFLDTGRLYRATALMSLENKVDITDEDAVFKIAQNLSDTNLYTLLENANLRNEETGNVASIVSKYPKVRAALLDTQRNFAYHPYFPDNNPATGAVLDGRDIGTTVCPDADIKLFITASDNIRAKRRFKELQLNKKCVTYEQVLADLKARDERDTMRLIAPLKPAREAYILDTSSLDIDEATSKAIQYVTFHLK